jgi:hypothetical protein
MFFVNNLTSGSPQFIALRIDILPLGRNTSIADQCTQ